ncbi:MAG: F0F1 ATP synthase subunit B [Kiritimatiellae bacterium]|jgi:F-type H+-transporting ATPase subunit b|nr:F0F1 ATP synthase subunit B [Kiritimatiellia bacterium]
MDVLKFDFSLFFWTIVTFIILLILLAKVALKPITKLMQDRENMIAESIKKAEKIEVEASHALAETKKHIDHAKKEAGNIINEGHKVVADMKKEARESSKHEASEIIDQAKMEVQRETSKSLEELKTTVANLSIRVARQVIQENFDEKQNEKLADEFIDRMTKNKESKR